MDPNSLIFSNQHLLNSPVQNIFQIPNNQSPIHNSFHYMNSQPQALFNYQPHWSPSHYFPINSNLQIPQIVPIISNSLQIPHVPVIQPMVNPCLMQQVNYLNPIVLPNVVMSQHQPPLYNILTPNIIVPPITSSKPTPLEFFQTQRGKKGVICQGYKFVHKYTRLDRNITWICQTTGCKVRIITDEALNLLQPGCDHKHNAPGVLESTSTVPCSPMNSATESSVTQQDSEPTTSSTSVPQSPDVDTLSPDMAKKGSIYINRRGNVGMRLDNFSFKMVRTTEEASHWRCVSKDCKARIVTTKEHHVMPRRNTYAHNHEPLTESDIVKAEVTRGVKRRLEECPSEKPAIAIARRIRGKEHHYTFAGILNLRNVIARQRLKNRPALPKNRHSVIKALEKCMEERKQPGTQLIRKIDQEVVMLTSDSGLRLLSAHQEQVFSDGTFRYAPMFFQQLYTFHIHKDGFYIPAVYFLLRDKKASTYRRVLRMLKTQCADLQIELDISNFTVDFEAGMIAAIKDIFPQSTIRGCRFHLAQSWMKAIRRFGMDRLYKTSSSDASKWLKRCFGLPGMASENVGTFFLSSYLPDAPPEISCEFLEYITENYMNPQSTFPPQMWADIATTDLKVTTNSCESWHRHFGEFFNSRKGNPNIYEFLQHLSETESFNMIKARSKRVNKRSEAKKIFIKQTFLRFQTKNMSAIDFLTCISRKVLVNK